MSTVIAGVQSGDGDSDGKLSEHGAAAFNEQLRAKMERRFPGERFVVVPGSGLHSEWDRLVRGNNYSEPTAEYVSAAESICEDLWQTSDPSWWQNSTPSLHIAECDGVGNDCIARYYLTDDSTVADHRVRHYATRAEAEEALRFVQAF